MFSVREWTGDGRLVWQRIRRRFGPVSLAVRSNAWDEDTLTHTRAGHYRSCLNVPAWDEGAVAEAIDAVITSYETDHPENRVLVQPMVEGVRASGVVITHGLSQATPYYVISYEASGRTDAVTAGRGLAETIVIHRHHWRGHLRGTALRSLLEAVEEVEDHFPCYPLELEFALPWEGRPVVLQVRPTTHLGVSPWPEQVRVESALASLVPLVEQINAPRERLLGCRSLLANMPDWNPAEIIGARPRPLALSLYRTLISRRAWRVARQLMGYRVLPRVDLLVILGGRPYVDVRTSFNSFLPKALDSSTASALVDAWVERLRRRPWLHDKVEFEVAQSCLEFDFDDVFAARYPRLLPGQALAEFREALRSLTLRCLCGADRGSLRWVAKAVHLLRRRQRAWLATSANGQPSIEDLPRLLRECEALGTLPFAVAARHAFIAESLLRSLVRRGALSARRETVFRRTVRTVLGKIAEDSKRVERGEWDGKQFLLRYGHLRPGTYDIRAPRYTQLGASWGLAGPNWDAGPGDGSFELREGERRQIRELLAASGLHSIDPESLLRYVRRAIRLREQAKFVYSRHISAMLEIIAHWGHTLGFDRNTLSFVSLDDILSIAIGQQTLAARARLQAVSERRRQEFHRWDALRLGSLVSQVEDLYCFTELPCLPNFVGAGRLTAPVTCLDAERGQRKAVRDQVVCIENADPGFDWIFTEGVRGLVTQYGGPNSHMAVRCAETNVPAALGCGESLYRRVCGSASVFLDCEARIVKPLTDV